jgi:hypothetical protein
MPAFPDGDVQLAREVQFRHVAAAAARWADADQIDRTVADVVVAVAAEILGREFPVARHPPFLDPAEDLAAAEGRMKRRRWALSERSPWISTNCAPGM